MSSADFKRESAASHASDAQPSPHVVTNEYIHSGTESLGSRAIKLVLRLMQRKGHLVDDMNNNRLPCAKSVSYPPEKIFRNTSVHLSERIMDKANVRIFTLASQAENRSIPRRVVLYLHGGCYVHGFVKQHWQFLSTVMENVPGLTIVAPDYLLVPKGNVIDAMALVEEIYRELVQQFGAEQIVIMGDSAGGGLALGFAQKIAIDRTNPTSDGAGLPSPDHLILLSPWLDVRLENEEITSELEDADAMIDREALQKVGVLWAGTSVTPSSHLVSPINGPLRSVAKRMSVFVGTHELFLPDCHKLKALVMEEKESEDSQLQVFDYFEYAKMLHMWLVLPFVQEAKFATQQVVSLLNREDVAATAETTTCSRTPILVLFSVVAILSLLFIGDSLPQTNILLSFFVAVSIPFILISTVSAGQTNQSKATLAAPPNGRDIIKAFVRVAFKKSVPLVQAAAIEVKDDGQNRIYNLPEICYSCPLMFDSSHLREYINLTRHSANPMSGTVTQSDENKEEFVPPFYLLTVAGCLQYLVIAHSNFPLNMLGAVNLRNKILLPRGPVKVSELKEWATAGRLWGSCSLNQVGRDHRRGIELDLIVQVIVRDSPEKESKGQIIFSCVFTILKITKPPTKRQQESQPKNPDADGEIKGNSFPLSIPSNAGRRFAKVSLDYNPIHVSNPTAKLFGQPSAIAHGMWAIAAAYDHLLYSMSTQSTATEFDVYFKSPVSLGTTVQATAFHTKKTAATDDAEPSSLAITRLCLTQTNRKHSNKSERVLIELVLRR